MVLSLELRRRVVATLPNTLTYIRASEVSDDLEVLRVDGKSPTAPDYPLQFE